MDVGGGCQGASDWTAARYFPQSTSLALVQIPVQRDTPLYFVQIGVLRSIAVIAVAAVDAAVGNGDLDFLQVPFLSAGIHQQRDCRASGETDEYVLVGIGAGILTAFISSAT